MSADWKAGDRALCVDDSPAWLRPHFSPLKRGRVYLVNSLDVYTEELGLFLAGEEHPWGVGWRATRFRKLVPACDRVAQEQEASL